MKYLPPTWPRPVLLCSHFYTSHATLLATGEERCVTDCVTSLKAAAKETSLFPGLVIFQYYHYPSHPSCITALVGQQTVRKQQRGTSCHTEHAS